jgi:hypothetical protein
MLKLLPSQAFGNLLGVNAFHQQYLRKPEPVIEIKTHVSRRKMLLGVVSAELTKPIKQPLVTVIADSLHLRPRRKLALFGQPE